MGVSGTDSSGLLKQCSIVFVLLASITVFGYGLRLPQCHSNYIDIDMSWPSHEIICEGAATNETVVWFLYRETRNTSNVTCPLSQPCCCNNWFNGTRNGTHSFLNNSKSYENRTWYSEFFISCLINGSNDITPRCRIDIIQTAELGTPRITVTRPSTGNHWIVQGTVNITKIYSSFDRYHCVWSYKHGNGNYTQLVSKKPFLDQSNASTINKTGYCDFNSTLLPSDPVNYTFRVAVSAGNTTETDSAVIVSPSVRSIHCTPSTDLLLEDTELNCTCKGSVGQPHGRLKWIRHTANHLDIPVKVGSYGDDTLQLTMTVNSTYDGDLLRCDVDWVTDITGPVYALTVYISPSVPSIHCTPSTDFLPEDAELNCTCKGSVGQPQGRLKWIRHTANHLDIPVKVGSYGDDTLQLTMTVNSTYDCDLLRCDVDWVTDIAGPFYALTVRERAEVTSFTVNNAHTTATVNESDSILFKCAARGRPTLNFQLSRNGSNLSQSRHNSTCHADAMLTTTMLRARCEDAGPYTCEVHDGVGNPDQRTVTVFVNCEPRLYQSARIPDYIKYVGETLKMYFPLTAFPVPTEATLNFNGIAKSSEVKPAREDMFSVCCPPADITMPSLTNCTLTIENMTEQDKGYYTFTFINLLGEISFSFQLDVDKITDRPEEQIEFSVGGGIGIALAVLVVVAVGVIAFRQRKKARKLKESAYKRSQQSSEGNKDPGLFVNKAFQASEGTNDAPLGETNGVSSRNICEDIEMHWTTPTIKPNPQADNPALGVAGTFATISKESEYPQSSDSVGGECIYATVNKKKKKPPLPVFNLSQDKAEPDDDPKTNKMNQARENERQMEGKK